MAWGWIMRLVLYTFVIACAAGVFMLTENPYSRYGLRADLLYDLNPARPAERSGFVQDAAINLFEQMKDAVMNNDENAVRVMSLQDEGDRIAYYAKNYVTGMEYTNLPGWNGGSPEGDYAFTLFFHGAVDEYYKGGTLIYRITRSDEPYPIEYPITMKPSDTVVYMWVGAGFDINDPISRLARAAQSARIYRGAAYGALALFVILLLINAAMRGHKRAADRAVAGVTRRIWLEFKLLFLFMVFCLTVMTGRYSGYKELLLCGPAILLALSFCWADLRYNGLDVFRNNSIVRLARVWRRFLDAKPYQKRLLAEYAAFIAAECVLAFLITVCFCSGDFSAVVLGLLLLFAGAGLIVFYSMRYARLVNGLGRIEKFTADLRDGRMGGALYADKSDGLYPVLDSLSNIQDGFAAALQNATKSERMRVELVTNVSHDLKTPLTSIISYVELLRRMELPEEAAGHVDVLAAKSERLKALIQDLFELAKAVSGQSELQMETLDFARLTEQTLSDADVGEGVFKVNLSGRPLWVTGDGSKLSRVLHNLFDNAKKYAMPGTRVYVSARRDGGAVAFEIKNVSGYEMNFGPDEVAERFVRGDASRSTDGSGLGLSIARGFTEACGGTFAVVIDGDIFSVRLTLPYRERVQTPPEPPAVSD